MKFSSLFSAFVVVASVIGHVCAQSNCETYEPQFRPQCYAWTHFARAMNQGPSWVKCWSNNRDGENPCPLCPGIYGLVSCKDGFLTGVRILTEYNLKVVNETLLKIAVAELNALETFTTISLQSQSQLGLELCFDECENDLSCTFSTGCTGDCLFNGQACPTMAPTSAPTGSPTSSPTFAPTSAPTFAPTFSPTLSTIAPTGAPTSSTDSPVETESPTTSTDAPVPAPTSPPSGLRTDAPHLAPTPTNAPTSTKTSPPTESLEGNVPTEAPTGEVDTSSDSMMTTISSFIVVGSALFTFIGGL